MRKIILNYHTSLIHFNNGDVATKMKVSDADYDEDVADGDDDQHLCDHDDGDVQDDSG